ncbi:MAG: hypothetical protein D3906_13945, partial [Candidatus Electrothrix sp. AUS1_2]|nr:hypothetical protein [Candidatus Electrothrix sp. AUS1_2]
MKLQYYFISVLVIIATWFGTPNILAHGKELPQRSQKATLEQVTSKVYLCFVIHTEEDDAKGVSGSVPSIPDYNGDQKVFDHFADAMYEYAAMLKTYGAFLSFQPDWTFVEGVKNFRPTYFQDLLALGTVEIVPHAHETVVRYDELYERLQELGANPKKIIGGMAFEHFLKHKNWVASHPDWAFWDGPFVTIGHVNDQPAPPLVYRISTEHLSGVSDLYTHSSSSSVIVSPSLPDVDLRFKPSGNFIVPSYVFKATRFFLAESNDLTVPLEWRKDPQGMQNGANMSASEQIEEIRSRITREFLPLIAQGKLEFAPVHKIINLFRSYESLLDLADGEQLIKYAPIKSQL